MEWVGGTASCDRTCASRLDRQVVNSGERCEISAIPTPVLAKLTRPFAASSRTESGRAEGPAPKLMRRDDSAGICVCM